MLLLIVLKSAEYLGRQFHFHRSITETSSSPTPLRQGRHVIMFVIVSLNTKTNSGIPLCLKDSNHRSVQSGQTDKQTNRQTDRQTNTEVLIFLDRY